jgi:hypothetical protein
MTHMDSRAVKFSISIEKLEIKFEGTQELGQQFQNGINQAIGGLVNSQTRMLAAGTGKSAPDTLIVNAQPVPENGQQLDAVPAANGHPANGTKSKVSRTRVASGGPSLANLLAGMKQEGYFGQPRSAGDVVTHLKDSKGHTFLAKNVMTGLQRMVQKGEADPAKLYRTKNESNNYIYKDTAFDEGPQRPDAADEAGE